MVEMNASACIRSRTGIGRRNYWRFQESGLIVSLLFSSLLSSVKAEELPPDCMQSFAVNVSATIIHYGWLPGGSTLVSPMMCADAESLREQLFIPGSQTSISAVDLQDMANSGDPLNGVIDKVEDLKRRINENSSPSQLRLFLDANLFLYSKYMAIHTCLTAVTPSGAMICAVSWLTTAIAAYDILHKVEQGDPASNEKAALIDSADKLEQLVKQAQAANVGQQASAGDAQTALSSLQTKLCREVQASCLTP